jgi:hypothetical protein
VGRKIVRGNEPRTNFPVEWIHLPAMSHHYPTIQVGETPHPGALLPNSQDGMGVGPGLLFQYGMTDCGASDSPA